MPEIYSICLKGRAERLEAPAESQLLRVLLDAEIFVENPCNGRGTCGKCKVRILFPEIDDLKQLYPVTPSEARHLSQAEQEAGVRLACCLDLCSNLYLELLGQDEKAEVLRGGYQPDYQVDRQESAFGIAVDIGTTTIAASLLELHSGKLLAEASAVNPQKAFGLDVLTRISYEVDEGEKGLRDLQECLVQGLNELIEELLHLSAVERRALKEILVSANTTMTHTLLGRDARTLGTYPYQPAFTELQDLPAHTIGLALTPEASLITLPHVSAFVGSDIVAGAAVCRLAELDGNSLFIDIGTNGEIVLAKKGHLLCCSCAAGPALEGMNISSGMRASRGAIEDIRLTDQGLELAVIGGATVRPRGLCGSGILAAIKELLRNDLLQPGGTFVKKEAIPAGDWRDKYICLDGKKRQFVLQTEPEILISQSDVRQVQLAKGAILSGFTALLKEAGLSMAELDRVIIAGQFGAHLPAESLIGCGILPREVKDKLIYVGNSSQTGAIMALLSLKERQTMCTLARQMTYLELADTDDYETRFRDSLLFPACSDFPNGRKRS